MTTAVGAYATTAGVKALDLNRSDTDDDAILASICDRVNQYIESKTRRILAPIASTTYLYDGDGTNRLYLPVTSDGTIIGGIRAISLLEVQLFTRAGYLTVDSTQYFLRGKSGPSAPYDQLLFTDRPTGFTGVFPLGFETVRITATAGWAAIPDDITEVALNVAMRAYHARQTGQGDVGADPSMVGTYLNSRDRETLRGYTLASSLY